MHAWYKIQHGDVETGSTYNFGCEEGRNAIPTAKPTLSRMPGRVVQSPTPIYAPVVQNSTWRRLNRK